MVILQGDIFWFDAGDPRGSGPGWRRPHVVVQNDAFNSSLIRTTVLCGLTSNVARAGAPGNILLQKGEANLPRPSVVNVSQLVTVDKSVLKEKIGALSRRRIEEIDAGLRMVLEPRELPPDTPRAQRSR
jgi:mRNA interferase MazF